MTGFGLGEGADGGFSVRVELRSVNHRFLQARFRLPSEFAHLEPKVDQRVKKRLSRGAVTMTVLVTRAAAPSSVGVDQEVAARYAALLADLAEPLGVPNDLTLSTLVGLPGVIASKQEDGLHEKESGVLLEAVDAALERLVEMRATEGDALEADIRAQTVAVVRLRAEIGERMPAVVTEHFENMCQRAQDLIGKGSSVDPGDLKRELAMLAEKSDISEETSRLDSHIVQLNKVLDGGGEVGRKLDFLVQELYREANTIGSKAGDAQVAHAVVDLKTHIERIREQVQNIE
ncbi:MAG: hypothetical protein ACI9F9_002150 [Candidatus Paceibacteria bacterium]|jgi:uncharacterized protein (TIGR00255 family)